MNREEYYKQRRIFRAALSSIDRSHLKMDDADSKSVWKLFFDGIYMKMPSEIYYSIISPCHPYGPWDIKSRAGIRCNYKYCHNSYPHKTRNP